MLAVADDAQTVALRALARPRLLAMPVLSVLLLLGLCLVSRSGFHVVAELVTAVMGISLYLLALCGWRLSRHFFLYCIALGFFQAALIGLLHLLSGPGLAPSRVFPAAATELLWLCARTVLLAGFVLGWRLRQFPGGPAGLFALMAAFSCGLVVLVLGDWLPGVARGSALAGPLVTLWEWLLMVLYGVVAAGIAQARDAPWAPLRQPLCLLLALCAAVELCFSLRSVAPGPAAITGQTLNLCASWLMLWLVTECMLLRPRAGLLARIQLLQSVLGRTPGMTCQVQRMPGGSIRLPFVSAGVQELLELPVEQAQSNPALLLRRIAPGYRERVRILADRSIATLSAWSGEWEVELPRQGRRWHRARSSAPVRQPDGSWLWVVHVQDITREKQLQDEVASHRDQRDALVQECTQELRQALQESEAALRAASEFLATMRHAIRSPLNAIVGVAKIAVRTPQLAVARPYMEQIRQSAHLLLERVNDMPDVAGFGSGKLTPDTGTVLLRDAIEQSVALLRPRALAKGLRLQLELADDLPQAIHADRTRLMQVLNKLLSNAVKFTGSGIILVQARAWLRAGAGWLHLSVLDSGIGMAPEQQARLFQPIVPGDRSMERSFGGSSAGLGTSKRLVEQLGGRMLLSSQPGVGSCFTVCLPVQLAKPPAQAADALSPALVAPQRLAGLRILVAEDDAVNQWVLRELLEQEGAQIRSCPDGLRALEVLATPAQFDVFITDIRMPGISGYEAARRALALRPDLPVVGLSARATAEERLHGQAVGMADYVTKPPDTDQLIAVLLRVTRRHLPPGAATHAVPVPEPGRLVHWADLFARLGQPDSRRQFLQTFIGNYQAAPADLRRHLAQGDLDALQRLAHKLQGSVGFLGASGMQQLARQVEELAQHANALPTGIVEQLAGLLERLLDEVAQQLQSEEANKP